MSRLTSSCGGSLAAAGPVCACAPAGDFRLFVFSLEGNSPVDRRLADYPQKAEAQETRKYADQHAAPQQGADHVACPA